MMRLAVLALVTVACGSSRPRSPAPSSTDTVTARAPAEGRAARVRRHTVQKMSVPAMPGTPARGQHVDTVSESLETVRVVDGFIIAALDVTVTSDERVAHLPSGSFKLPGIAGRSFGVAYTGASLVVADKTGAELDPAVQEDLLDRYRLVGRADPFLAHAPRGMLAIDARVPSYEDAFREHFRRDGKNNEARVTEARVVHTGVTPDEATFSVHMTIAGKQHVFAVAGTFEGTLSVGRADGWVRRFMMHGRFRGHAPEAAEELVGEHVNEVTYRYE